MTTFANGESGLSVRTKINNVLQHADGTAGELVINEAGADVDFRVESDTNANALFVDGATGNVGIGTSSPEVKLDVVGDAYISGTLFPNSITSYSGDLPINVAGNSFIVNAGATERMRVDASGNVGIGTSSPSTLLHLGGANNKSVRLDTALGNAAFLAGWENTAQFGVNRNPATGVVTDSGKAAAGVRMVGEAGNSYVTVETTSTNNAAPTERLRIDASGSVGIGTSSPNVKLAVSDADTAKSALSVSNSTFGVTVQLACSVGVTDRATLYTEGAHSLAFGTNSAERVRIDASGNLLVGTPTSGASKLRISGLPTSSAGLSAGDVWNDGGTLKIA